MAEIKLLVRKGAVTVGMLGLSVFGQTGSSLLERQFIAADSSIADIVNRSETRMKEIAPAESLFQAALAGRPEFLCVLRTNSKGLIVNAISREDESPARMDDVSGNAWYSVPLKTLKPYYSALLPGQGNKHYALYWSRPIRVKNAMGLLRFGGVVAVKINIAECFKRFAAVYGEPFQILLDGKEFYYRAWDPAAPFEEKTIRIPGVSGLTCKIVVKNAPAAPVSGNDTAASAAKGKEGNKENTAAARAIAGARVSSSQAVRETLLLETKETPIAKPEETGNAALWKMGWLGTIAIVLIFIVALSISRKQKKLKPRRVPVKVTEKGNEGAPAFEFAPFSQPKSSAPEINETQERSVADDPHEEESPPSPANESALEESLVILPAGAETIPAAERVLIEEIGPGDDAVEIEKKVRSELGSEIAQRVRRDDGAAMEEKVRQGLFEEIKREVNEKETNSIRNAVINELKADIRQKLEKNEAEAIHAALQQEMTDAWREEIKEKYYATFHEKELENLVKVIREKLVEKEMPLLVESHRTELSKEIREKMVAAFSEQIELHERNALKAEIVKKLQLDEYPLLLQEEREKLRASLMRRLSEKEVRTLEEQAREELTGRIRTRMLSETEAIHERIREEMTRELRRAVMEEERDGIVKKEREEVALRVREELLTKEQPKIRERLLAEITEEQRTLIATRELQAIIEAERARIAELEAPALRQQVRDQLREEEKEAMHARVKTEIYAETIQAVQAGLEEKYTALLETRMAEYKNEIDAKARLETYKAVQAEYNELIGHMEGLAASISKVEALDSLAQTITLLTNEKKKYKYFNLNSAQTESLLEYLKRVQSRFNIFLDTVDQSVREMELKVNSVMNKLNESAS